MMSTETEQVRALAREFAAQELRPHVRQWDEEGNIPDAVWAQLAELGFFGMLVPEEQGGLGFNVATYLSVLEELAWGEPALALTLSLHSAYGVDLLLRAGTPAQKERWLGVLGSGEVLTCFALAEPHTTGEAEWNRTRARRSEHDWILHGAKRWVANGRRAGLAVVAGRIEEPSSAGGRWGLEAFLVPTDSAGYEVTGRSETLGLRALEWVDVRLEEVHLPPDSLVGEGTSGAALARSRDLARCGVAAVAVGVARAALEHARDYAGEREQFGHRLREFEGIQFKLAEMAERVTVGGAVLQAAAASPSSRNAAMAKVVASEAAMWVSTQAVQVFGGYGYMRHYPVEKLMRDAKATELLEGTTAELRTAVAAALYSD
jgi:alkylation response protein AidB-like acyl-CoA dehydrogenase